MLSFAKDLQFIKMICYFYNEDYLLITMIKKFRFYNFHDRKTLLKIQFRKCYIIFRQIFNLKILLIHIFSIHAQYKCNIYIHITCSLQLTNHSKLKAFIVMIFDFEDYLEIRITKVTPMKFLNNRKVFAYFTKICFQVGFVPEY